MKINTNTRFNMNEYEVQNKYEKNYEINCESENENEKMRLQGYLLSLSQ